MAKLNTQMAEALVDALHNSDASPIAQEPKMQERPAAPAPGPAASQSRRGQASNTVLVPPIRVALVEDKVPINVKVHRNVHIRLKQLVLRNQASGERVTLQSLGEQFLMEALERAEKRAAQQADQAA